MTANFTAFEIEAEVLSNLREYALANSLYWALTEGHACEISSRRNAMDVSISNHPPNQYINPSVECLQERR